MVRGDDAPFLCLSYTTFPCSFCPFDNKFYCFLQFVEQRLIGLEVGNLKGMDSNPACHRAFFLTMCNCHMQGVVLYLISWVEARDTLLSTIYH